MKVLKFSLLVFLIAFSGFSQSFQNSASISGLTAQYFGDTGGATSTSYYVQAVFPNGRSAIAGPATITTPATRTSNNRVLVSWTVVPGAIGYDVMTNTTGTVPSGACNCALATNVTTNAFTDVGQATLSYTTDNPNTLPVATTTGNPAMQMSVQTAIDTAAITAANMLNGLLVGTPTAAATYTTPSASTLTAAMGSCVIGRTYLWYVKNTSLGANTITIGAGMNVTVLGTATIAQNAVRGFLIYVTACGTPAVTVYSLNTGAF